MSHVTDEEYKAALSKMQSLFTHSVVYLYGYRATEGDPDAEGKVTVSFYRISVSNEPVTLPRTASSEPFPAETICINLWGDKYTSGTHLNNAQYNCASALNSLALVLTLIGFEVFVNDAEYRPEETVDWQKL